ncbi:CDP-alcohol phosphatidyltransferase family protein [Aurantiacibacter gangjinensis]|uniref:CDP-alcohol phosphatidyltransferase family protein n=1 Tax=Aurantiacibacter gangjinensis TaxID=502682 RepID=UPI0007EE036A|nr:phosphatidylcholine/phosphatidylserine synthase [Aurantiacibacter gangjinensis]APE29022.1 CDP-diacylglycerol--serine O-phosphatidyltransferase [Aurantiacibacter gangjinensis]
MSGDINDGRGDPSDDFDQDDTAPPGPAWLGPRASEGEFVTRSRGGRGLSMRAVLPNAITTAALASGLTSILFAVAEQWPQAVFAMIIAGILDTMDGRVARLLKAQSRFGAELDSLADSAGFGIAPALVLYLWALVEAPRFGWLAALAYAICCALRLARFNAQIDADDGPRKKAGYLTGVPAPMGAGFAFMPMYLWLATGQDIFRDPLLVGPWVIFIALLMVSSIATPSWKSLRPKGDAKLALIALAGLMVGGLLLETWWTLILIGVVYMALIAWAAIGYGRIRRANARAAAADGSATPPPSQKPLAVDEVEQALAKKRD